MAPRVVGAGLPRTATHSLEEALEEVLGGTCLHMRKLPNHPFDLGERWRMALRGDDPGWSTILDGYTAAVDWPTSQYWRELSAAYPDALVLLSVRESVEEWWRSVEATILPYARMCAAPDWTEGRDLATLFERFTGTSDWDDPATLMAAYERHNAAVREAVPADRLVEWRAAGGWEPICAALGVPVPARPFPWRNKRSEWG
jgi:hypothetical protein